MQTVSLEAARLIDGLGVKYNTHFQYKITYNGSKETIQLVCGESYETKGADENGVACGIYLVSAYTLQELFDILPQIGEKLGWKSTGIYLAHLCVGKEEPKELWEWEMQGHRLTDAYLDDCILVAARQIKAPHVYAMDQILFDDPAVHTHALTTGVLRLQLFKRERG